MKKRFVSTGNLFSNFSNDIGIELGESHFHTIYFV